MNCEEMGHLLPNLLDHELAEEMAERIHQHLLTCFQCAWELQSLEEATRLLQASAPPGEGREGWKDSLLNRLEARGMEEGWLRPSPEPISRRQLAITFLRQR